jgi:hypothetical protein
MPTKKKLCYISFNSFEMSPDEITAVHLRDKNI